MAAGEERRRQAVQARISRVRRHLNLEVFVRAAVGPLWVAVTTFVVWRMFVQRGLWIFGAVALVLAAVVTWLLGRSRRVSQARAAVIADRQADAGGLLLTRLELPVGEWELGLNQQLKSLPMPEIEVRRPAALLGLALCFLAIGLLVPQPALLHPTPNAAAATRVEELVEKMEAIAKEEPMDQAAAEELQRLQEEVAENSFDAADWEAADALDKQLDKQAAEASRELERAETAAKNLEDAMADAQSGEAQQRERDELERALMDLSDGQANSGEQAMDQALGENGEDGKPGENGKPGESSKSSTPSRSKVNDLRKALQQRQDQLAKQFSPGQNKSPTTRRPSGKSNKGEGQGEGQGEGESGKGQGKSGGDEHASRGVEEGAGAGRGGEANELVFGGQAEIDPERLKYEPLPEGNGGDGEELMGLRGTNPKHQPSDAVSPSSGTGAAGDQAAGYDEGAMRPRNRALVQRYFDSK